MDRTREEAFQLLADDLVKEGLLRLVALVIGHLDPVRDRVGVRTTVGDTSATATPTVLNFQAIQCLPGYAAQLRPSMRSIASAASR